eukprot:1192834-Prorocentrum_minimum.AAC.5
MVYNEEEAATKIQAVHRGRAARKTVDDMKNQPGEEPPAGEEAAAGEPPPEEPAAEDSAAEAPAPEEPDAEAPASEEPDAEAPATEEPAAEDPAHENPEESASAPEHLPPPPSQPLQGDEATCHFIIYPENYKHTKAFSVSCTVDEVLQEISAELHIDRSALSLALDAQRLNAAETLQGLGVAVRPPLIMTDDGADARRDGPGALPFGKFGQCKPLGRSQLSGM